MTNQVIALSPTEMQSAQTNVLQWCAAKLNEAQQLLAEARQNVELAQERHWDTKPFKRLIRRYQQSQTYYEKVAEAVKRGYLIVPNMSPEIFAIRTAAKRPNRRQGSRWDNFAQKCQKLPVGEGRYIDPEPYTRDRITHDREGNEQKTPYPATLDEELHFPVALVKPVIIEATQAAMADKIFDQIGIVHQPKRDPMIVGEIYDASRYAGYRFHHVSFFIAWFLDCEDI